MKKRFPRGLVVGKFAPLHRGHELVINRALASCEEVFLLSYSNPELPGCEPAPRERWLQARFPECQRLVLTPETLAARLPGLLIPPNDADDRLHRRFVGRLCLEFFDGPVDAVFTSEHYGDGFAEELSRFFAEELAAPLPVTHVLIDQARTSVPVCGTTLREYCGNPEDLNQWLSPQVCASFVRRICLLGGESSGKTTLTGLLARQPASTAVYEYGREFWEQKAGQLRFDDLLQIARHQVDLEQQAQASGALQIFCDTSPLTTLFYSLHLFGRAAPELLALATRPYSLTLLCAPDFPFVQDGTRVGERFRDLQHQWYLERLARFNLPWRLVTGTLQQRVEMLTE